VRCNGASSCLVFGADGIAILVLGFAVKTTDANELPVALAAMLKHFEQL